MKMPTARQTQRQPALASRTSRRRRAAFPADIAWFPPLRPSEATHDFLVPNPRPDLTIDPQAPGMLEGGASRA